MMSPEILFTAEYIKNVLYFVTVRQGKVLKNNAETHYFSIDDELIYENYYSDFGPLNLGCVYKYCSLLNDKFKQYLNKQAIVHYTSIDPKKKTNSAFLMGCYGVLYLSLSPKDALKPLMVHGQSYRPFQDAVQGDSSYTISLIDCLQAILKARQLGLFNFQDFNCEEYDRLDKIQGGDLNWIVPGKFLAFIGPVDYSMSLYHPPEMYIDYFLENNVKIVIRLNKRLYDGNVFNKAGIAHYDLYFPDGSCPPRHILFKFLQISESADCAIAVHCKAGLGRTGSLIGCYLIKHYRMTSHEAIGWMRICRPGSVIGHQQDWLEKLELWLLKQGNLFRKRNYQDTEKLPIHEFGLYSFAEKTMRQQPVLFHKSQSSSPPMLRQTRLDITPPVRPQASKVREDKVASEEEEIFITSCDLTVTTTKTMTQLKGCVMKSTTNCEENCEAEYPIERKRVSFWKKYFCCQSCTNTCNDRLWMLAVRCASIAPNKCNANKFCGFLDMVAVNKVIEKNTYDWRVKTQNVISNQKVYNKGDQMETRLSRRSSAAGEPRVAHQCPTIKQKNSHKSINSNSTSSVKSIGGYKPLTTFRTTQGPTITNVNDARNFLLRSSLNNGEREKQLKSTLIVTPNCTVRSPNYVSTTPGFMKSAALNTGSKCPTQRRRLGRSPSVSPQRMVSEQTRATNTPTAGKFLVKDASKSTLIDSFSKLKLANPRAELIGAASVGAASLGARRDAPFQKRTTTVRSDERPIATQGDLLNSIKFQRRYQESLRTKKFNSSGQDEMSVPRAVRENTVTRKVVAPPRPSSPTRRRNIQTSSFY